MKPKIHNIFNRILEVLCWGIIPGIIHIITGILRLTFPVALILALTGLIWWIVAGLLVTVLSQTLSIIIAPVIALSAIYNIVKAVKPEWFD